MDKWGGWEVKLSTLDPIPPVAFSCLFSATSVSLFFSNFFLISSDLINFYPAVVCHLTATRSSPHSYIGTGSTTAFLRPQGLDNISSLSTPLHGRHSSWDTPGDHSILVNIPTSKPCLQKPAKAARSPPPPPPNPQQQQQQQQQETMPPDPRRKHPQPHHRLLGEGASPPGE